MKFKGEARTIVQSIADHIARPDLRASFLASTAVSAVMA
jgi:hypothetical protein